MAIPLSAASPLPVPLRRRAERLGLALPPEPAPVEAILALAVEVFFRPQRWPVPSREAAWRARGDGHPLAAGGFVRLWQPDDLPEGTPRATVLLAHGWEGRATQLTPLAAALLAAGWPVAAVDAPAHGEAPGDTASMPRYAANLLEAGRRVGPLAAAIGHSFGGAATVLALSRGLAAPRAAILAAPADITALGRNFVAGIGLDPALTAPFLVNAEIRAGLKLAALDGATLAARLRLPGLLLHDPADRYVDFSEAETLAAAWPGAVLEPTPGPGHLGILTDPGVLARLVEFVEAKEGR